MCVLCQLLFDLFFSSSRAIHILDSWWKGAPFVLGRRHSFPYYSWICMGRTGCSLQGNVFIERIFGHFLILKSNFKFEVPRGTSNLFRRGLFPFDLGHRITNQISFKSLWTVRFQNTYREGREEEREREIDALVPNQDQDLGVSCVEQAGNESLQRGLVVLSELLRQYSNKQGQEARRPPTKTIRVPGCWREQDWERQWPWQC